MKLTERVDKLTKELKKEIILLQRAKEDIEKHESSIFKLSNEISSLEWEIDNLGDKEK